MAKKRKKPKIELRYYQMSAGSPILALLGEKKVHFSGRDFTVIPPNYPHTTNSDLDDISRWEYLFIDVEGFVKKFLDNPVKAEKVIQRIYSKALYFKETEQPELAEENFKQNNIISKALDFVSCHYIEDIKVNSLAKYCHISETHFRRVFTAYMKVTPLEYINIVRVHTACELLRKTDEPVADIALKCGFTTNSTFNRNFKQVMGVLPIEWRKRPENYEQQLFHFNIHSEEGW